jgi:hypothetical protein
MKLNAFSAALVGLTLAATPAIAQTTADNNAAAISQYQQDMSAYRAALRAHHHAVNANARVYDHQQRAYADAMAAWRMQVRACHHGHTRACNAPAPDPANYW